MRLDEVKGSGRPALHRECTNMRVNLPHLNAFHTGTEGLTMLLLVVDLAISHTCRTRIGSGSLAVGRGGDQ